MKDIWYGDNKDVVKWSILYHLADFFKVKRIIQIAFYAPTDFGQFKVYIDGQEKNIPPKVISHFRDIKKVSRMNHKASVEVFDAHFDGNKRQEYLQKIEAFLSKYHNDSLIVFLDPDTGLQPMSTKYGPEHVLNKETKDIFDTLKQGDVFVFYQHQTNRRGEEWIGPKRKQLAEALGSPLDKVKIAQGPDLAKDVVFFYVQKDN